MHLALRQSTWPAGTALEWAFARASLGEMRCGHKELAVREAAARTAAAALNQPALFFQGMAKLAFVQWWVRFGESARVRRVSGGSAVPRPRAVSQGLAVTVIGPQVPARPRRGPRGPCRRRGRGWSLSWR
ncbi:hypothetical protein GCM10012280_41090 [Wenjunlia tyrosinilytica]|uniref:Uncharacterized protein n=1 Tax=Wenjunlia tyrosinilytica TaxID=1544741 RepID=A0A918DYW0_9ACTN|nr:hypothetical protein GCM10012280_41090 [Wenjunlia tyrosinilytica]